MIHVTFSLSFSVAPNITDLFSNNETFSDGDTLILTCVASGAPPPQVQWQKDDINITGGEETNLERKPMFNLQRNGVGGADAGTYHCIVFNKAGIMSREINVEIESKYMHV